MGRGIIKMYQDILHRRPYLVQAVQTGTLMAVGDVLSQTHIENSTLKDVDYKRTLKFASIGFFVCGPALRAWYGILNKKIGSQGTTVAIKKVILDQCIFAPTILSFILVAVPATHGKSWEMIKYDLRNNYLDVLKTNYCVWPWVQLVNFYFVPLQYQVLINQIVALFWNIYLSWKTNKKQQSLLK